MPRLNQGEELPDPALAEREAFERGFKRSARGNLWRRWQGLALTIFKRRDDLYGWSIGTDLSVQFSSEGFATEQEAMDALAYESFS